MTKAERDELRERLSWLRPQMHVELPVALVRELLDDCDRLEAFDPDAHDRIALQHYREGAPVDDCKCITCEAFRVQQRWARGGL